MSQNPLSHIATWVFDLDNTLYPPSARLFDQIEARMNAWVARTLRVDPPEADRLRGHYWTTYGTTLAGLMAEHGMEPGPYLQDVHDISFAGLTRDPQLAAGIAALPGRRIIYTNATRSYAQKVLEARGLSGLFDAIYGVDEAQYVPKPERRAFETIFALDGLDPSRAAMFEDDARNLIAPHDMGMATIHVAPTAAPAPHIHHHTDDLGGFLSRLLWR